MVVDTTMPETIIPEALPKYRCTNGLQHFGISTQVAAPAVESPSHLQSSVSEPSKGCQSGGRQQKTEVQP
jgi:hypothetical protein